MINTLQAKHENFQKKFALTWISTTLAFVIAILIILWQSEHNKILHQFDLQTHDAGFHFEEVIENVLDSLDSIPIYSNEIHSNTKEFPCKKSLPFLDRTVFNSLYISAIAISNKEGQILCATQGSLLNISKLKNKQSRVLLGPFHHHFSKNPAYFLQKKYPNYHIGAFLLEHFLDNIFKKEDSSFDFIGLYNIHTKKMIYKLGSAYLSDKALATLPLHNETIRESFQYHSHEAILPLNNLDNIHLILQRRISNFAPSFISRSLLYLLPLLLLSWWFYHLSKEMIRKRFSIDYALSTALKEHRFFPLYQPIRNIINNTFCGAEVLMRWKTAFNEVILPDHFIDAAEKSGLIVPMTLQLIETVFQECQPLFQNKHLSNQKLPYLSFNLCPAHFEDPDFFSKFYALCEKYGVPAQQLTLELTERGIFNQSDSHLSIMMQSLRDKGFSLSIDDFGTGQANMKYLQDFPFNYLKIDKSFVSTIGTGAIIETLNQGIIQIARSLQLEIIAEGVETEQQLDFFVKHQVKFVQGWLFAKAMPYKQFEKLFENP